MLLCTPITSQIEIVRHDRTMEQIVFSIPEMCESLTNDSKVRHGGARRPRIKSGRIFRRCQRHVWRDEMAEETTKTAIPLLSQLAHVHLESNPLQLGRHYQLYCRLLLPIRHWWTRSWSWNSSLRFVSSSCQLKFHLILKDLSLLSHLGLIWAVTLLSAAVAITLPKPSGIRTLVMTVIMRSICSAGPQPTLMLLGTATVLLKGVHLLSIMDNAGTFHWSVR